MRRGELTRQAVLAEAMRLASVVGLGGLTIGSLARTLGMSKSGLFAHFRAKESLQIEVLGYGAELFRDHVVRPALAAPRGEPRLRTLFGNWLAWARDRPGGCLFVSCVTELDDRPGRVRDQLLGHYRDWLETVAQVFRTGVGEGHFRADADPDQFVQDLEGVLLAYHFLSRLPRLPAAERRAHRAFEELLTSVRAQRLTRLGSRSSI